MFIKEDNTFSEMIEKSTLQWLEATTTTDDLVNQQGARLTLEYIESLKKKIKELEDKNELKDEFLKKMKAKAVSAHI